MYMKYGDNMNKAIRYRIYPTILQTEYFLKCFGCCRFVYNQALNWRMSAYKADRTSLNYNDTAFGLTALKHQFPWLKEVDSIALQQSLRNLDAAYQSFFKKNGGFPKFKSAKFSRKSYTTINQKGTVSIADNGIKLPKIGIVKAKIHRQPKEDWIIKSATVSQECDGTYYISILFEYEAKELYAPVTSKSTLGLDYKSDGLYVDSNSNDCDMPHYYRLSQDKLAKSQRKLKHKTIGSNNYRKQQKKIAKIHRHISNQRKDFLHKKSTEIANQYTCVCVESLNMRTMANKGFGNGKATLDNGYGMFINFLEYKLKDRGGYLIKVDKWFPSSQLCHWCGYTSENLKNLRIRKWDCPHCGHKGIDRDWNSAINIKVEGLRILESA